MLRNLDIQNIAVIDRLSCGLEDGMTVLTGETGAGKSIIIDSINMILGARTNKMLVRYGADKALVQAMFSVNGEVVDKLAVNGIETENNEVFISREITADGKSIARINGVMAPQNILREISGLLINIHGQQDNQALLTSVRHVEFLDAFARDGAALTEYRQLYGEMRALEKRLSALSMDEQERLRRIDLLEYQITELEKADLKPDEKETLLEQRKKITNSEKIAGAVAAACGTLYEGEQGAAYDAVCAAVAAVSEIADMDENLQAVLERLTDMQYAIEDAVHELKAFGSAVEFDGRALDDIEQRLDLIWRMEKKYGGSTEAALEYFEAASAELVEISDSENKISELSAELETIRTALRTAGQKLTAARKRAGNVLSGRIQEALEELDMPKAEFSVQILPRLDFAANGMDEVEFLISPNPGEPLKPLVRIASGGELSRVMLAMKSVLADTDNVDTLIFDEIDTGVSGSAAQKIAQKLSELGAKKQVICISHQPQLAAAADHHFLIRKAEQDGRTATAITLLDEAGREKELARMIDGDNLTETAINHAREMRKNARRRL